MKIGILTDSTCDLPEEILNQYKNLPLQLYKYMNLVDYYLQQIACIINKYVDMIV